MFYHNINFIKPSIEDDICECGEKPYVILTIDNHIRIGFCKKCLDQFIIDINNFIDNEKWESNPLSKKCCRDCIYFNEEDCVGKSVGQYKKWTCTFDSKQGFITPSRSSCKHIVLSK